MGWKAVPDGVSLHEESESEQEGEPDGTDHSPAIDNSVGNSRRRVGFLLGFCLSPPLALAVPIKQKTLVSCATWSVCLVRPNRLSQASAVPRVSNSREALVLQRCLIHTWLGTLALRSFPVLV